MTYPTQWSCPLCKTLLLGGARWVAYVRALHLRDSCFVDPAMEETL